MINATEHLDTQLFAISGMTCGSCVRSVQQAIQAVPGVENVRVELAANQAVVQGSASADALIAAVESAGYHARPIDAAVQNGASSDTDKGGCCR